MPKIQTLVPFVVMGAAAILVSITLLLWRQWGPKLLINETASEPFGIYRLVRHEESDYRRGMFVVFPVPRDLRAVVYGRHWMRNGIPFLKELLGVEGDRVCVFADRLEINTHAIGPVFERDSTGQSLPQQRGCFIVQPGYFFAASHYLDKSFDGRYFGALPVSQIQGEARPVWTF
jgi:conjugative transfer signal peptidase TraF